MAEVTLKSMAAGDDWSGDSDSFTRALCWRVRWIRTNRALSS